MPTEYHHGFRLAFGDADAETTTIPAAPDWPEAPEI